MTNQTQLAVISEYMRKPEIYARFAEALNARDAGAYVTSVLLAVANSEQLQKCTPASIYMSALRAATLRLNVDPSTGQAYLIPFRDQATLIIGYKGLHDMAVRTNRYRYINVGKVYAGEGVEEDRFSGWHKLTGRKTDSEIIGWLAAFEMTNGYGHTLYMTVEDIHAHAARYNPHGYTSPKGIWKINPQAMERKTVLRLLLRKWGYLDPSDAGTLAEIEDDNHEILDGEAYEVEPDKPEMPRPAAEILSDLGFEPEPPRTAPASEQPPALDEPDIPLPPAASPTATDGTPYADLPTDQLAFRANSLAKALRANDLSAEQRAEKQAKLTEIQRVLKVRNQ